MAKNKNNVRWNKKGSAIIDVLLLLVVIFGFAIATIFGLKIANEFNWQYQNSSVITENQSKEVVQDSIDRYVPLMDGIFMFLFIGFAMAGLISAFFVDSHPAFFIISIILLCFIALLGAILGNAFEDLTDNTDLAAETNQFGFIPFVFDNILTIVIGVIFLMMIAAFAKFKLS